MADFESVTESFTVSLLSDEGGGSERVSCQIGLNGLFVQSPDGRRTLRKYPLNHISRWALRGSKLVLYTKTPVDVEERTVTLQGDERTIRSVLDTLTCCCMQMVELLQSKEIPGDKAAASSLSALLNASQKKLPTADEVTFWENPEKVGWLQSQGDHLKIWRRRWFVLKDGFLLRFADPNVTASSKPRGIVDLSKVTEAIEARTETGKENSLKLVTATGSKVCYLADSETEQVEWLSALDGAVAKILKQVAGVEDEPAPTPASRNPATEWAAQLKDSYSSASSVRSRYSPRRDRDTMVKIVGYEGQDEAEGPRGGGHRERDNYGGLGSVPSDSGYGSGIAGVAGVRTSSSYPHTLNPTSSFSDSFVRADYPSYPVLAPQSNPAPYSRAPAEYRPAQQAQEPLMMGQPPYSFDAAYGQTYASSPAQHFAAPQPQPQAQPQQYVPQQPPQHQQQGPALGGAYPMSHQASGEGPHQSYQSYQPSYQAPQPEPTPQPQAHAPPPPEPVAAPLQHRPDAWQTYYSEGRPYYYNATTGVTQWTQPTA